MGWTRTENNWAYRPGERKNLKDFEALYAAFEKQQLFIDIKLRGSR